MSIEINDKKGLFFTIKFILLLLVIFSSANYLSDKFFGQLIVVKKDFSSLEARLADIKKIRTTELPLEIINTASDQIPQNGKYVYADLAEMKLALYENGKQIKTFEIISKGKPGSYWETPTGEFKILLKEINHFSSVGNVYMPYSAQFFGNFYIHGWPYYPWGEEVGRGYSGGCIRMSTQDAKEIYSFVDSGTSFKIAENQEKTEPLGLKIKKSTIPEISAQAFLVADIKTGEVFASKNAEVAMPIASLTKLMTAIVTTENIMFDRKITLKKLASPEGDQSKETIKEGEVFGSLDLLYPLLLQSSNSTAHSLALFSGEKNFISKMNDRALSLGMTNTHYEDSIGISGNNVSTSRDLFLLAKNIFEKKSYILNITKAKAKNIYASDGDVYNLVSFNYFAGQENFLGGKTGFTNMAGQTMLSIFSVPVNGEQRPVAIIVLNSENREKETETLLSWLEETASNQLANQ